MKMLFFILFFCFHSYSQTLIVSDVDDTIKTTYVAGGILSKAEMLRNALLTKNSFAGMADLYHNLLNQIEDVEIVYLSAAPKLLVHETYSEFLHESGFPKPQNLVMKKGIVDTITYKTHHLNRWIHSLKPKRMILIGDNGEKDAIIYKNIKQQNPNIDIYIFIRAAYSLKQQTFNHRNSKEQYFVSPLSIVDSLLRDGILQAEASLNYVKSSLQQLLQEEYANLYSAQVFPYWQRCKNYTEDLRALAQFYPEYDMQINWAEDKVNQRCDNT